MTQNETTMGNVLDNIYAQGPGPGGYGPDFQALFNYLLSLSAGDQANALFVYNEISGEEHAQLQQTTLDILNPFNGFMGQRLDQAKTSQGSVGFAAFGGSQYAQASAIMSDASQGMTRGDSGVSLWARGYGQKLSADGDLEAPGYDQDTGGVVGGVDFAIGQNAIAGAALGWSSTDVSFNTPGDNANVDTFQVGAYGSYGFGRFYVDGELAGAFHDLSTTRFLNLPNPPGGAVAGANYNARSFSANGEFGAVWRSGNFIFQPNAGLIFTDVDTDSFIESGAGDFNLIVGDSSATSLASSLGARFATQFKAGGMNIMPELSASWRHEFDDDHQSFTAAFPDDPASTFNIISSKIDPNSALIGAGVTAGVTRNVELFLNYNGLLNSDVDVHNGSAGLRATW
jgi:outer membrane autotransporter protein